MDINPNFSIWVITPALIFIARLLDVSIGTIRIMMLSRGRRVLAPILGFFEIIIWLTAIRQIFQHLDNWAAFIAYAGGFAAGTAAGMWLEDKLAIGLIAVRVITTGRGTTLIEDLRNEGFGVTDFTGEGQTGEIHMIYAIIGRREIDRVMEAVRLHHPKAFVTISDVRSASEGFFPESGRFRIGGRAFPGFLRKGK